MKDKSPEEIRNKYFARITQRNAPVILIVLLLISSFFNVGAIYLVNKDISAKVDYIYDFIYNGQKQAQQPSNIEDEFSLLSDNAKAYYELLGEDRVSGTPTWLINNVKYVGFDYKNNLIPQYELNKEDVFILFTSPTCGFCEKAEEYLNSENIIFSKVCAPIHPGDFELCEEQGYII